MTSMKIGAVLRQLQEEFPDLTISKIRYLDSQGVVSPSRTESRYRAYSGDDVDRLVFALRLQRDRYLPLRVIKGIMRDPDAHRQVQAVGEVDAGTRLNITEAAAQAELSVRAVKELQSFGVLHPGEDNKYSAADIEALRAARVLLKAGLGARHLRAVRIAADREIALLQQIGEDGGDYPGLVNACLALHRLLVVRESPESLM